MKQCEKCGVPVSEQPLHRVNPTGENGIWWCLPCIEKHEPELAKNIKSDTDVMDIINILTNE